MALFAKTNAIGLDAIIHKVQSTLYTKLNAKWGLTLDAYPRCYVLEQDGVKTIEYHLGGKDYSGNLITAEGNKFFFMATDDEVKTQANQYTTILNLYFVVNVEECRADVTDHRADNEVRTDVMNVLNGIDEVRINRVVSSYFKVFLSYGRVISQHYDADYKDDMHPYHFFKIELSALPYTINKKAC
jgi:hypothetical protein